MTMHQLIECFLAANRLAAAAGSIVSICQALDREALAVYAHAQAEAARRLCGKKAEAANAQRILKDALAVALTKILSQIDLSDSAAYALLRQAVDRWCPWQLSQQKSCLLLRQTLLTLLPAARQKQKLEQLCRDYRAHLKIEIEKYTHDDHTQARIAATYGSTLLFGAPALEEGRAQVKLVRDSRPVIERMAANPAHYQLDESLPLTAVLNKYRVVSALQNTLKTPVKSASAQLRDFRQTFDADRAVIEKDRDSVGMKFIKVVATLLSLGLAYACGIWQVKGKIATDNIQRNLQPTG
jgi:hypothetical protein